MKYPKHIAIDGPAASGKSTVAEIVAHQIGYLFFDTGVMYRAVTLASLQRLNGVNDEKAVSDLAEAIDIDVRPPSVQDERKYDVLVDGVDVTWDIRKPEVDANVSRVSAYAGVRKAMTAQQRKIGERGQVVMVGRDIGTVVLPDAELKVFLDASVEERARRRYDEVQHRNQPEPYEQILQAMKKRDEIDSTRDLAPLCPADDAHILNTEGMTIQQVVDAILAFLR
ncbi:cytidylate kinase [Ornatilinea apprima]|uniref:Cytidylate kinase n=1 Tax=Ornatilinea apprima TaxID=1134406 RepID=A0A0P6Y889_9CHLR|nr:(d)CMP kinase [Ornatilinea apprima]KPL77881.1 cytidylate kinase [Ornatilinea apprima]